MRVAAILGLGSSAQASAAVRALLGCRLAVGDAGERPMKRMPFWFSAATARCTVICRNWSGCGFQCWWSRMAAAMILPGRCNCAAVDDALSAWRKFVSGRGSVRQVDLGVIVPVVSPDAGGAPAPHGPGAGRYFGCVGGVGLDVEVARRANRLPRAFRRRGGYLLQPSACPVRLSSGRGKGPGLTRQSPVEYSLRRTRHAGWPSPTPPLMVEASGSRQTPGSTMGGWKSV